MMRNIYLFVYYLIANKLPRSEMLILGYSSNLLRRYLVGKIFLYAGSSVNINRNARFGRGTNVSLGDFSSIGENCQIANDTHIGNDVMMAPEVIIFSVTHETKVVDIPMRNQGNRSPRPVVIGNNVWIGQRAIILPGVTIGDGAIIGAGAVVTKNILRNEVVAGNPARHIRFRE
nr:DapH/DapD/GlmU-related protein [Vibrio campbellii]